MLLEHLLDLVEEDAGLGLSGLLGVVLPRFLSAEEEFAFGEKSTQKAGESGDTGTGPEEGAPGGVGDEVQVHDGGDEVADGVTLLQDAAGETTGLDGQVLEGGGGG